MCFMVYSGVDHELQRHFKFYLLRFFLIIFYSCGLVESSILGQDSRHRREIIITDAVRRIRADGFPAEQHKVFTKDGYILTLHRIPYIRYLKKSKTTSNYQELPVGVEESGPILSSSYCIVQRPVVLLLAGIYASSDVWLLNGPTDSLPYILSRHGFDVWLGNNRGNIYSRENIWYNDTEREFWNFSWHEMSIYDLPAMLDFIRSYTGEQRMHFIGLSQGATILLVLNSMLPQYNRVFKTAVLLAPVSYIGHSRASLAKIFGPILGTRNYISKMLEGVEMVSTNRFIKKLLSMACLSTEPAMMCVSRLWPVVGYNTNMLNMTLLPDLMANFPVGGSVKQIMHYFQGYMSQKFRQYDYGPELNWLYYGQLEPPEYNLKNVTTPTIIYYAENDYIVSVKDMWTLIRRLGHIKAIHKLPHKYWNHFDFICGLGVRKYIFDHILEALCKDEFYCSLISSSGLFSHQHQYQHHQQFYATHQLRYNNCSSLPMPNIIR